MGGGSNDAGFVQVMKSKGVDRAEIERLDKVFEKFVGERPDILGGIRAWTGTDTCVDVMYFTSEAEARKGEQAEMPDELKEAMGDFEGMGDTEYLDLTDPQLRLAPVASAPSGCSDGPVPLAGGGAGRRGSGWSGIWGRSSRSSGRCKNGPRTSPSRCPAPARTSCER